MGLLIYKDRKNTDCAKWDGCEKKFGKSDLLPLWVADMDFEVPVCVKEALMKYVDLGTFGYPMPSKSYKEAFIEWEEKYHQYTVKRSWIRFAPGVVPAFNWIVQMLTKEKDSIIILSPVYYPFRNAVLDNDRTLIESHLIRSEEQYEIDFEDFEKKIVENKVKLFIFCSPHNPVGRVWKKEEIQKLLDICKKYKVYVISDEIHQDIIMSGQEQVTAATVGDYDNILITLTAATKTFNLAACQNSFVVIPDEKIRNIYDNYTNRLHTSSGNAFGYVAVQAAYEGGRTWLQELRETIESNYILMKEMLEAALPQIWISKLQGTYLMWIDLGNYVSKDEIEDIIKKECGLAVDFGSWFGGERYASFIRVNLATKRENIKMAAENIIRVLKSREEDSFKKRGEE